MFTLYNKKGKKVFCDLDQLEQVKNAGYTVDPPKEVKKEAKKEASGKNPNTK